MPNSDKEYIDVDDTIFDTPKEIEDYCNTCISELKRKKKSTPQKQ